MKDYCLTGDDYNLVSKFLETNNVQLLVADLNGVIDDYYRLKFAYLREFLGEKNIDHFARLVIYIEREYMIDREATLEQSIQKFCKENGINPSDAQISLLSGKLSPSHITDDALTFFNALNIDFVVYTSLNIQQARESLRGLDCEVYTRDDYTQNKPSVENLQNIFAKYGVEPNQACVIGDGLTDDLMPASLLGAHTLLVTPFTEKLITL